MYYMTLMVPNTIYGIGILWSSLTLYGTGIVWSPYMYIWSPQHAECLHVLYDSYGPHTLYGIGILWSPPCTL